MSRSEEPEEVDCLLPGYLSRIAPTCCSSPSCSSVLPSASEVPPRNIPHNATIQGDFIHTLLVLLSSMNGLATVPSVSQQNKPFPLRLENEGRMTPTFLQQSPEGSSFSGLYIPILGTIMLLRLSSYHVLTSHQVLFNASNNCHFLIHVFSVLDILSQHRNIHVSPTLHSQRLIVIWHGQFLLYPYTFLKSLPRVPGTSYTTGIGCLWQGDIPLRSRNRYH